MVPRAPTTYGGAPLTPGTVYQSPSYKPTSYSPYNDFDDSLYDDEGRFVGRGGSSRERRTYVDRYVGGFDFRDYDDDRPISSASRHIYGWGSVQGYGFGSSNNPAADATKRASYYVARLANTVRNSGKDEKEKAIHLRWADKKNTEDGATARNVNDPSQGDIVLDPHLVYRDGKDLSSDPNTMDGVGGKVLLAASMKRTVSKRATGHMLDAERSKRTFAPTARSVFEAAETAIARDKLLADWPGAAPYLARHAHLEKLANRDQVQEFYDKAPKNLNAATAAAQWNIMHPANPVAVSPELQAVIDGSEPVMTCKPDDRYKESVKVAEAIMALCDPPENSGGGGGASGGGGDGDAPSVSDSTMFHKELSAMAGVGPESGQDKIELFGKLDIPNDAFIPSGCPNAKPPKWVSSVGFAEQYLHYTTDQKKGVFKKFEAMRKKVKAMSREIAKKFAFRRVRPAWPVRGLNSGDVDDGSLDKLAARREVNPNIWERHETVAIPDVAVGILIDQSGSMSCNGVDSIDKKHAQRIELAKMVAIALGDALRSANGIKVMIASHFTASREIVLVDILGMDSKREDEPWMGALRATGENADSFAAQDMVKRMARFSAAAKHRVLFVVSDGQPSASVFDRTGELKDYGGDAAAIHMREVVTWSRRVYGVEVYGIGIDGSPDQTFGERMYGQGRFVCLNDTLSSAGLIGRFVAKVATRM